MNYIEFLRMRRNITWLAGVLAALALLSMISINVNAYKVHVGADIGGPTGVDVAALFGLALGITLIFATIVGGTLSRENETPEMARTKPFPREQIAFSFLLTDLAAILLAFVISNAFIFLIFLDFCWVVHVRASFHVGEEAGLLVTLGLGVAFMWYALVQAVSSGLRGRGGITIGLSWAYFTILLGLSHVTLSPVPLHDLIMALNLLNPLAYMNSLTTHGDTLSASIPNSIFTLDPWLRAAIVWLIGIAAGVVASYNWKRLEF